MAYARSRRRRSSVRSTRGRASYRSRPVSRRGSVRRNSRRRTSSGARTLRIVVEQPGAARVPDPISQIAIKNKKASF